MNNTDSTVPPNYFVLKSSCIRPEPVPFSTNVPSVNPLTIGSCFFRKSAVVKRTCLLDRLAALSPADRTAFADDYLQKDPTASVNEDPTPSINSRNAIRPPFRHRGAVLEQSRSIQREQNAVWTSFAVKYIRGEHYEGEYGALHKHTVY